MGFLPRVSAVPLSPGAGLMLRSAQLTLAFDRQVLDAINGAAVQICSQRGTNRRREMPSVRRSWQ